MTWRATGVLAALALVACTAPSEPDGVCPQTAEFGNYGCAVFSGRVVDANGSPVSGVSVGPGDGAEANAFTAVYATTKADGRFAFVLTRMVPPPPGQDSATLWIRAALIPVPPQLSSSAKDSVLTRFTLAPVGSHPDTVHVTLPLAVSPAARWPLHDKER